MAFRIDRGSYDGLSLDGLSFVVVGRAPGPAMADANIAVGVIVDERATAEQQQALVAIASGQAGGPMAALGPLVSTVLGVEARPIQIEGSGLNWSASVPGLLDQAVEGVRGSHPSDAMYIDNTAHPTNARLALAKALRSHLHALGLDWDDESGANNGHFAPFDWRG